MPIGFVNEGPDPFLNLHCFCDDCGRAMMKPVLLFSISCVFLVAVIAFHGEICGMIYSLVWNGYSPFFPDAAHYIVLIVYLSLTGASIAVFAVSLYWMVKRYLAGDQEDNGEVA